MYTFDDDRVVEPLEPGLFRGTISGRWDVVTTPNGGYVVAVASSAIERTLPGLDPLSTSTHFLRPAQHGPCEIAVEVPRAGRRFSTALARLRQGGKDVAIVTATYGTLGDPAVGPRIVTGAPPEVPPADAPEPSFGMFEGMPIVARFEGRIPAECLAWTRGEAGSNAEIRGRVRFSDGRPPCLASMSVFADGLPFAAFNVVPPSWIPSLELTVHARARPVPGWLRFVLRTRFLFGGYLEEDGELWDETGTLVAQSRQLAALV